MKPQTRYLTYSYYGGPLLSVTHAVAYYLRQAQNGVHLSEYFFRPRAKPFKILDSGDDISLTQIFKSESQWSDGAFKFKYGIYNGQIQRVRDYGMCSLKENEVDFVADLQHRLTLLENNWRNQNYFMMHYAFQDDLAFHFLNEHYHFIAVESNHPLEDFLSFSISSLLGRYSMGSNQPKLDLAQGSLYLPRYLYEYFHASYQEYKTRMQQIKNKSIIRVDHLAKKPLQYKDILEQVHFTDWRSFSTPDFLNSEPLFKANKLNYFSNQKEILQWFQEHHA